MVAGELVMLKTTRRTCPPEVRDEVAYITRARVRSAISISAFGKAGMSLKTDMNMGTDTAMGTVDMAGEGVEASTTPRMR